MNLLENDLEKIYKNIVEPHTNKSKIGQKRQKKAPTMCGRHFLTELFVQNIDRRMTLV